MKKLWQKGPFATAFHVVNQPLKYFTPASKRGWYLFPQIFLVPFSIALNALETAFLIAFAAFDTADLILFHAVVTAFLIAFTEVVIEF